MSLLFNMPSKFVLAFLQRNKHLLITWLQSPSAVILEPEKIISVTFSIVFHSICHEVMGPDANILVFWISSVHSVQFSCSVLSDCDPMNCSTPGLPVHHQHPEFTQTHAHRVIEPSSHLILGCPLLLLPPIPPSIRVFSNESTLCMRWPKYWSFSFNFSPSNEHPGLISLRMD